jgi:hypothetical protein
MATARSRVPTPVSAIVTVVRAVPRIGTSFHYVEQA